MRVTFFTTYNKMSQEINRKKESIDRLSTQVSSGQRLLTQDDDPLAWAQSIDLKQSVRELGAFKQNVDFASDWNGTAEQAVSGVAELLVQAQEQGIAARSSSGADQREILANTLDHIIQQAVELANTRSGDMYQFSGTAFSTPPFEMTMDPEGGGVLDVSPYQGNTEDLEVRVGKNVRETVTMNGQAVFADPTADVFQSLLQLKAAVLSNDDAAIASGIEAVDQCHQHVTEQVSAIGVRMTALDSRKDVLDSMTLDSQKQLSDVADTDVVSAISSLQQKQTAFQAALQVTGMLKNLNLTQYL